MRTGSWIRKGRNSTNSSSTNNSTSPILSQKPILSRFTVVRFGLVAGLISSLAISGLILMVEKVTAVPIGTFYMVLMAALTDSHLSSLNMITIGLLLHLVSGSIIGLVMAIPFATYNTSLVKTIHQYAPAYGLLFGLALWSILFLPVTYWMILPLVSSLANQVIEQQVPTGRVASIETSALSDMSNEIIFGALPFNMFYGLLSAIIIKLLSENYLYKKELLKNASKMQP
ncbi:MAG TPA: hypothetical protein VJ551_01690 [Nitrososphaeraceae archaeon]|nr:hypothetical protein [Nitrososphaeraceae archaeon]